MSYAQPHVQPYVYPTPALGYASSSQNQGSEIAFILVGGVLLFGLGYIIYKSAMQHSRMQAQMVREQGIGKTLEFDAGEMGIAVLGSALLR